MTKTNQVAIEPQFRVEIRVSYVARKQGIEVPLGFYEDCKWRAISFVEGDEGASLELSPRELMDWLAYEDFFGAPIMEIDEAEQAVTDTIERCRALAEAVRRDATGAATRFPPHRSVDNLR